MQCLNSVAKQTFRNFEILVLSDASTGRDEQGRSAKKIVKAFSRSLVKNQKIIIRYLENSQNLVLVETRRRLVEAA